MDNPATSTATRWWLPALAFGALFCGFALALWVSLPPPPAMMLASAVLGVLLATLSAIDVRVYRLPDLLTLPLLLVGLAAVWMLDLAPLWWRIVSAAIGWGLMAAIAALYERARGTAGLGLGDAKLVGAGAAWIGGEGIPTLLLVGAVSALLVVGVARLAGRRIDRTTRVPFGPFLAFGIWFVWLLGPL